MNKFTTITVKTSYAGFHRWLKAPEKVSYLRHRHRHMFFVELRVIVTAPDREIEFFTLQGELKQIIERDLDSSTNADVLDFSCEHIAGYLYEIFSANYELYSVSVSEDGENCATVTRQVQR